MEKRSEGEEEMGGGGLKDGEGCTHIAHPHSQTHTSTHSPPLPPPTHTHTGDSGCMRINKIRWLNTDANPLLMFTGGLPEDQEDEHNALTVIQGADHIALDFTSAIVDFIPVIGRWDRDSLSLFLFIKNQEIFTLSVLSWASTLP